MWRRGRNNNISSKNPQGSPVGRPQRQSMLSSPGVGGRGGGPAMRRVGGTGNMNAQRVSVLRPAAAGGSPPAIATAAPPGGASSPPRVPGAMAGRREPTGLYVSSARRTTRLSRINNNNNDATAAVALPPPSPHQISAGRFTVSQLREDSMIESTFRIFPVVLVTETFGESAGRCRSVHKILLNLGVEEDTELKVLALDTRPVEGPLIGQYVARTTGHVSVPILFVGGTCLGDYSSILGLARNDGLRAALADAGVEGVVPAIPLPTLRDNIYGYPKGLVEGQEGNYGRGTAHRRGSVESNGDPAAAPLNVLVGCCGSSASDKVPELVERCVARGWNVKLLTTSSGEHFFKSFGMDRIVESIGAENIYRDEDEWSFEYERFGMPVRACHLALRKWADVFVVAPITCNSMAKAVAGIGDNLLSSTLVAWEYQKKKLFLCPACNADMWNNPPTQRNVAFLKEMGAEFLGPRVDKLTNGQVAIGCMENLDAIVDRLWEEEAELLSGDEWYWRRARKAASQGGQDTLWGLVARAVEEGLLDVKSSESEFGNSLLHLAAGAESMIDDKGKFSWGSANHNFLSRFIELGANVNARNKYDLTPLHVAVSAGDAEAVKLLLGVGADCSGMLLDFPDMPQEIREMLEDKPEASRLKTGYYFTYGSLKRGFPNHKDQAEHLTKFVGAATTMEEYPLVVPLEPSCSNPNCPYLHKQASLVEVPGTGKRVVGEVFEVTAEDIIAFDKLETFQGITRNENAYNRRVISVEVGDRVLQCYVYFATSHDPITMVEDGKAEYIEEYLLDMSKGDLKPEFKDKFIHAEQEELAEECRRSTAISFATGRRSTFRSTAFDSNDRSTINPNDRGTINRQFLENARKTISFAPAVSEEDEDDEEGDPPSEYDSRATVDMRLTATPVGMYSEKMREVVGSVQQAINTCNLASITLALETLGVHCSINDIFLSLRLPVNWVVGNGLTLAQVFDILVKMCGSTNEDELLLQGVNVKCFHFDEGLVDVESLHEYLKQSVPNPDSVLIANFNTQIARNSDHGGGHFSVISGYDEKKRMVSIADVHPQKYGAHWGCSLDKLFRAMTDKDSSSKRARGLISVHKSSGENITTLDKCGSSVSFCDPSFSIEEQLWLSCWGNIRGFDSHTNMGGLSALALALSGFLSDEDMFELGIQRSISADEIAWMLELDICALLNAVVQPDELTEYSREAIEALGLEMNVYSEKATKRTDLLHAETLAAFLRNHIGGGVGVALVLVDINKALGFEAVKTDEKSEAAALDHGVAHWCVLISVQDNLTAIIADPRGQSYGRLWKCSLHNLLNGLVAEKGSSQIVVVRSKNNIYQTGLRGSVLHVSDFETKMASSEYLRPSDAEAPMSFKHETLKGISE